MSWQVALKQAQRRYWTWRSLLDRKWHLKMGKAYCHGKPIYQDWQAIGPWTFWRVVVCGDYLVRFRESAQ